MMDPIGALSNIGGPTSSRLSFYVFVQIVSILFPGVILLTELLMLSFHFVSHHGSDATFLAATVDGLRGAALIIFACVGLAASYVIGRISRGMTLWLGRLSEPLWQAMPVRSRGDWTRVETLLGAEVSERVLAVHPVLRQLLAEPGIERRRLFGQRGYDTTGDVIDYCKLWLRRCGSVTRVDFSVDHFEAEINIVGAMCFPVLLLGVDAVLQPGIPIWGKMVLGVLAVAGALTVLSLSVLLRAHERWQALRNVAFAQAMEVTMADSADQDTTATTPPNSSPSNT
jgi:hypothetical protein